LKYIRETTTALVIVAVAATLAACGGGTGEQQLQLHGTISASSLYVTTEGLNCPTFIGSPKVVISDGAGKILVTTKASAPELKKDPRGYSICEATYSAMAPKADVYKITTENPSSIWRRPLIVNRSDIHGGTLPDYRGLRM
jgi:hypothetical protein